MYDLAPQFGAANVLIAPTVRVNGVSAERDGFVESGAGILNLTVAEDRLEHIIPGIGLSFGTSYSAGGLVLRPELQVLYERVFGDEEVKSFAAIPIADAGFLTTVSAGDEERVALGAGLGASLSRSLAGHVRYDGSFGDDTEHHRGSVDLTVRF